MRKISTPADSVSKKRRNSIVRSRTAKIQQIRELGVKLYRIGKGISDWSRYYHRHIGRGACWIYKTLDSLTMNENIYRPVHYTKTLISRSILTSKTFPQWSFLTLLSSAAQLTSRLTLLHPFSPSHQSLSPPNTAESISTSRSQLPSMEIISPL